MSRHMVIACDLCESEPAEEHPFGLDGAGWKMDLCNACAAELRKAMERWISNATRTRGGKTTAPVTSRTRNTPGDLAAVRAWAEIEGIEVPRLGQIPRPVWKRWRDAGSPKPQEDVA